MKQYLYSTVTGYFLQDELATVAETFDFMATNFGLLERNYEADALSPNRNVDLTQWERFEREVRTTLNREQSPGEQTRYKVLFLGRHGQGVHNVAERRYGTAEWDRYWAAQDGDSIAHWVDAHLTDLGIQQAQAVNAFWERQLTEAKTPAPESYYTSPMRRCLATANLTFANLDLSSPSSSTPQPPGDTTTKNEPLYRPVVKELLREVNGVHTCDRRSSRSTLAAEFPNFTFEAGFAEHDELWTPDHRETNEEIDRRMKKLLDDIFTHDDSVFVSLTAHSGAICSLLRVLGHREFRLSTGAVIPVLVKAVTVS
ncbi:MAG: hypothetical protein LQ350_000542 [Teloschistes chrysophthalmus]|nr:MAG: hypothetical protein LQ350_000542 [Niorma chrysophthalma]